MTSCVRKIPHLHPQTGIKCCTEVHQGKHTDEFTIGEYKEDPLVTFSCASLSVKVLKQHLTLFFMEVLLVK